jgi:hypothetical protein
MQPVGTAEGTIAWSDWELEWEVVPKSRWLPPPPPSNLTEVVISREPGKTVTMPIDKKGTREIKPYSRSGLPAGLKQLSKHDSSKDDSSVRALITYLPLDKEGKQANEGRAKAVRVFATFHVLKPGLKTANDYLTKAKWWDLGPAMLPKMIFFPRVEHGGFFGMAVSPWSRSV